MVRLEESPLNWLIPLALTVAAFAGDNAYGSQTNKFQAALATFRSASFERVEGLVVRIVRREELASECDPAKAFWDAETNTILVDTSASGWVEALAGPLQRMLERGDLGPSLRLALSKLGEQEEVEPAQIVDALTALDILESQLDEVRKLCAGALSWIVGRLRPAVALLDSSFELLQLDDVDTHEQLHRVLGEELGGVPVGWLIERAADSRNDRAMGLSLFTHLGSRAELNAWNEALVRLGPPYRSLENEACNAEFTGHVLSARTPLCALARFFCKGGRESLFPAMVGAITKVLPSEDLASRYWSVPFSESMRAAGGVFRANGVTSPLINRLMVAASVEQLIEELDAFDTAIQPRLDPTVIHSGNRILCKSLLEKTRRAAIVWCRRHQRELGVWSRGLDELIQSINAQLDAGPGFVDEWDEARVLKTFGHHITRDPAHKEFWEALDASVNFNTLLQRLGFAEVDLGEAEDVLRAAQEKERRAARQVEVCGVAFDADPKNFDQLWPIIIKQMPDTQIDTMDLQQLTKLQALSSAQRRSSRGGSGGRATRLQRVPEDRRKLIGLVGEMFVYRLLTKKFGNSVVSPACWVSELSVHVFHANKMTANDALGYDFEIHKGKQALYFEVKSTSSEGDEFELGSSEIRKAVECAKSKRAIYRIVHVHNALSSSPTYRVLPNPYEEANAGLFVFEDAGLRVRYRTAVNPGNVSNPATTPRRSDR
jgi:hypothetical protein